jgi:hypothetical protein
MPDGTCFKRASAGDMARFLRKLLISTASLALCRTGSKADILRGSHAIAAMRRYGAGIASRVEMPLPRIS